MNGQPSQDVDDRIRDAKERLKQEIDNWALMAKKTDPHPLTKAAIAAASPGEHKHMIG